MRDFWRDSGYHLLGVDAHGRLRLTDEYLRAYFRRPEVRPVAESCAAERRLHEALLADPRQAVSQARLAMLADPDARENYRLLLAFRDRLLLAGTLEDAYLGLFLRPGGVPVPPLFVDQLAHVLIRHVLDGCDDPLHARAGELFFREQAVTINEGFVMAADAETVETHASGRSLGELGRLVAQARTPLRTVDLDVLDESNAQGYWARADRFDTVLNLNFAGPGLDAFCRVLEGWIRHFLDVAVSIQPVQRISDARWVWHIGLDREASRLLDDLWNGEDVGEARLARLLSLFRMDFADPGVMPERIKGRPVYLALMMTEAKRLKLKPQNLLVNLPLAEKG